MLLVSYANAQDHMSGSHETVNRPRAKDARVCLCGVRVDSLSMGQVLARARDAVAHGGRLRIAVVNVAKAVNMCSDTLLRHSVQSSDLVLADGMPLVWLSHLRRNPLPERVAGIDLMFALFELAQEHSWRIYLLGASHTTLERVTAIVGHDYPGATLAGCRDGYFSECEEGKVAHHIRKSRPDVLLIGMSSPKKERFMSRWVDVTGAPLCHGVGGAFDVMAGKTSRAPQWMQRCGLEWLYRLIQEPRRMWRRYLVTNVIFSCRVVFCVLCRENAIQPRHCPWLAAGRLQNKGLHGMDVAGESSYAPCY